MDMWQDNINGAFEVLVFMFVGLHCLELLKDKKSRGVSLVSVGFFFSLALWRLYYYPVLGQWWSFSGGVLVAAMHGLWFWMIRHYNRKEKQL